MQLFGRDSAYAKVETTRTVQPSRPVARLFAGRNSTGSPARTQMSAVANDRADELAETLALYRDAKAVPPNFADRPIVAQYPYSYESIKSQNNSSKAELAWTGINLFVSRLWPVELARMSISSTGRDHRYDKYLTSAQKAMVKQGYQLFINPVIAGDLNAFGQENNQKRLTGAQIEKLAQSFDTQFTFMGDYGTSGIFTALVGYEFDSRSSIQYEAAKRTMHTTRPIGGMKGGGYNAETGKPTGAYWGITQFGASTYRDVVRQAKGWGVILPAERESMTFGQMLVAAYVLAIIRQPTLVRLGLRVDPITVYINHNQGSGVWKKKGAKGIKASAWDGQSAVVRALLKSYGFKRA